MLEQQISDQMKEAMKNKEAEKLSTLRMLWAAVKNERIEQRTDSLDDQAVISIIKKQVKQRQDSIDQFTKAGRTELAEKETNELNVLKTFLPEELSDEALEKIIDETIQETGAASIKEMGKVMKGVIEKAAGRADNRKVSEFIKKKLA